MEQSKRTKEMSFQRPHHAVDLVETVLEREGSSVVCVAKDESKLFIAFRLFQEVGQRNKKAGKMVLLVDDGNAEIVKPFLSATSNQGMFSVKTYFHEKDVTREQQCLLPSCDIMVTEGKVFLQLLEAGILELISFSLIIFDKCHLANDVDHPFAIILKHVDGRNHGLRPRIVGLSSEIQHHLGCSQDLERFLITVEKVFHCKALISNDLLALNRYGEQAEEEIIYYSCVPGHDQLTSKLKEILQNALLFLKDITVREASQECVMFVTHIFTECRKILALLGPQQTTYIARIALKEIGKLEKKCTENHDLLILQFCRTQLNFFVNLSEQSDVLSGCEGNFTVLTTKLLWHMSAHLKTEYKEELSYNDGTDSHGEVVAISSSTAQRHYNANTQPTSPSSQEIPEFQTDAMATSTQSPPDCTVTSQSSNLRSTYGTNIQCDDPLCVVLVPSTMIAKALNSLINKLSNTLPKYSFLKSACVHSNKAKQGMLEQALSDETEDNVMACVQDGSINVLVATFAVEKELYVRRCSLLIRLGMPTGYWHYSSLKKKLKSAGAKLVILVRDQGKTMADKRYKVYQGIEDVLVDRYPNSRPPCHEVTKLFHKEQLEAYEPYGVEGPKVDLLSSISLVNSYCSKFPSSGVGAAIPVCRTQEVWTDNEVEFVSTLYLPRNSPVYWPVMGSATLKRSEVTKETARKARVKSEMCVALETCCQLHKAGELSDDLQPRFRFQMLSLTAESEECNCEVADSGTGMAGSLKRNRAYKKKFPSILEDNFPACDEPSYLYSITMKLTKPWTFERAVRSQSKVPSAAHCLGILSRKPLPKLPGMLVFDRAGEVTVTVAECSSSPVFPSSEQLSLIQRFTEYIFRDIAKPGNASEKPFPKFDPTIASSGYYIVLLKDVNDDSSAVPNEVKHKEIACDFMQSIENALGSFDNPTDPPPAGIQNMEIFIDAVVTAVYNDKRPRYYVADICYDRSPADPFPNSEAAATFAEYYQIRYGSEVNLEQPLLDVDHISSRLNFLLPRYQNIKGQFLALPGKDSKRSQKAKLFVIPELCSIHPMPGYLWRQLFILPTVLYRVESLVVAEEFRASVARALGRGAVDWPNNVPLPQLTLGEMVGEVIVRATNSVAEKSSGKPSGSATEKTTASQYTELCKTLTDVRITEQESLDGKVIAENLPFHDQHSDSDASSESCCDLVGKNKTSCVLTSGEVNVSGAKVDTESVHVPVKHEVPFVVDDNKPLEAVDSESSLVIIWTDPLLSRLYQTCGPSSTLILRALTTCSAGDVFSLERLEMLGDSFVKYAISSSVFFQHQHENEGKLSFIRGLKVSNRQLFYLARQRGLPSYMVTRMFTPVVNWLPPGFYREDSEDAEKEGEMQLFLIPDTSSQELEEEDEDGSLFVQEELSGPSLTHNSGDSSSEAHSPSIRLNPYLHHCCSDKAIADTTEALVGTYLLCYGPEGAWNFLEWLGAELTKQEKTQDGYTPNTSLVDDAPFEGVSVESDSTSCRHDMSKRPCTACRSSDKFSQKSEKTSDPVSSNNWRLPSEVSAADMTRLEEALKSRCEDKPQATCQKFVESSLCLEKTAHPVSCDSALLSNHTSPDAELTTNEEALNCRRLDKCPKAVQSIDEPLFQPQNPPHSLLCDSELLPDHKSLAIEFATLEEALNYRFSNHSLLQQAFTHTSLPRDYNSVRCSYEQLEFLGDAILDFLVTRHLYMYHRHMSPGDLTDLRSAVVNNYSFAALAVKLGFAKHFRSLSPPLFSIVDKFIEKFKEKEIQQQQAERNEIYSSVFVLGGENKFVEVEVPKVLGDLFEAVAGALYVDCGQDLDRVWQVYLPILKPTIDYYSTNPPMSAVRKLLETMPNAAKFAPVERMVNGKFKSTLTVSGCGTFIGTGRNFRIAKSTAAQRALNALQQKTSSKKVENT